MNRLEFVLTAIIIATLALCSIGMDKPPAQMIEETYTVRQGDTLWTVSEKYIVKNTYGRRDLREFTEGLYQCNYDTVFAERETAGVRPKEIFPGDELKIRYWVGDER